MMTNFMRDNISLRKFARRTEALFQFIVKRQVDINLLIAGTIKWTHRGLRRATG